MTTNKPSAYFLGENKRAIIFLCSTVAVIMTVLSGLGLAFPDLFYPSPEIAEMFLSNDLVNIIIGLPFFLVSLAYFSREKLLGTLLLPGAVIYVFYNYFAYLLGKPFNWAAVGNLILVLLSVYLMFLLLRSMDHPGIKAQLEGGVAERFSGWILVVFGLGFLALALSEIIPGVLDGSIPPLGEKAVSAADILVSIAWIAGGIQLLRRKTQGYSLGLGLLMAASSLFIGLILFFFIAPVMSDRAFDWSEVITVLVMGMVCFVPSFLYIRGVVRSQRALEVES